MDRWPKGGTGRCSSRELKPGATLRFPEPGGGFFPFAPASQRIQASAAPDGSGLATWLELNANVAPGTGGGYVFPGGSPHVNFVGQMGFTDLNLEVSFDDAHGNPFRTAPGLIPE